MPRTQTLALALTLALVACGDGPDDDAERQPATEAGGAPVFVPMGEMMPGIEVEVGYGWTVLHCNDIDGVEFCLDMSDHYLTKDGQLCGPVVDVEYIGGGFGAFRTDWDGCRNGPVTDQDRWIRVH